MVMKTNNFLADFMEHCADTHRPYIYGTYGQVLTEAILMAKAAMYPDRLSAKRVKYAKEHYLGKRTDDCYGGVKNARWLPDGAGFDATPIYDSKTDISADTAYNRATVKGPISTIPKVRGICVRYPGHAGVLTDPAKGIVCEFRGFDYGCVRTKLSERKWTHWFQDPYIKYEDQPQPDPKGDVVEVELPVLKKGMKGLPEIGRVQMILNGLGYKDKNGDELETDNSFGGKTDYCVREFQKKNSLVDDGVVGKNTWEKLMKYGR